MRGRHKQNTKLNLFDDRPLERPKRQLPGSPPVACGKCDCPLRAESRFWASLFVVAKTDAQRRERDCRRTYSGGDFPRLQSGCTLSSVAPLPRRTIMDGKAHQPISPASLNSQCSNGCPAVLPAVLDRSSVAANPKVLGRAVERSYGSSRTCKAARSSSERNGRPAPDGHHSRPDQPRAPLPNKLQGQVVPLAASGPCPRNCSLARTRSAQSPQR